MSWFLVHTIPNREMFAERVLQDWLRCSVYLPRVAVERVRRRKLEQVVRPFFPRYAFVEDDGRGVRHIRTAPGVARVIGTEDGPARVPQSVIDELRGRERDDVVQLWRPGQPVLVGGLAAVFKERDGVKRAQVLVKLFGSEYVANVGINQIGVMAA